MRHLCRLPLILLGGRPRACCRTEGIALFIHRFRALALTVAVAAIAAVVVQAPAAFAAAPARGRLLGTITPSQSKTPVRLAVPLKAPKRQQCTPTPFRSRERRAGGVKFCVRTDNRATQAPNARTLAADSSVCSVTGTNQMQYQRFVSCLKITVSGTLVNSKGEVIGTATLNFVNSVTLDATASTIDDQITATVANTTGAVVEVAVSLTGSCSSACTTTEPEPWTGAALLAKNQSVTGTVVHSEILAKGTQDSTRLGYDAYITVPDAVPAQPNASWDGAVDIRCDNSVGASAGCVYPGATPDLELSASLYKAAAITYLWAQLNLPDGWGAGTPLRRLADDSAAEANRARTCEDGTFVPLPDDVIPDDSCDEFPFAKTYEGGTPGGLCADIAPILEDGQWTVYEANPDKPVTGTEKCVRGHVTLIDNTNAGGALGRFTTAVRLLDLDKYTVTVVA